jgi:hypothetical protein
MPEDTREDGTPAAPELSAAALREWSHTVESVMRGIAHALNNRAAALSAVIELSRDPTDDPSVTGSILGGELERVQGLGAVINTLGQPRAGTEAFAPSDAAEEAIEVLKLHGQLRDRTITIDASSTPPTRAPRWMFVRSLIALAVAGSRGLLASTSKLSITVAEDGGGDWIVASVDGAYTPSTTASPYMCELARAMGGEPLDKPLGFRVPTLTALRQREAR